MQHNTHTLPTLCHQASAQPSNSSNRAKMAPEPFFCPWRTHTHTQQCGWWSLDSLASVPPASALHPSSQRALPAPLHYLSIYFCTILSCFFPVSLYQDLWYSLWFHPTYLGIDSYLLPPALLSLSGLFVSSLLETNLPCNVIQSSSSLWRYSFFPFLLRSCLFLPSVPPVILWLLFPSTPFTAKATPANASRSGHSLTPAAHSRGVWDGHRCGGGVPWCWRLRDASLCNLSVYMCVWFKCVCPLLLLALICV